MDRIKLARRVGDTANRYIFSSKTGTTVNCEDVPEFYLLDDYPTARFNLFISFSAGVFSDRATWQKVANIGPKSELIREAI